MQNHITQEITRHLRVNYPLVINTKDSEEEESPDKERKKMIIRIISNMEAEMYKKLNEFKEDTNKQLKE
jgi:hypothetical protein